MDSDELAQLSPKTHPSSFDIGLIDNFQAFAKDITAAVRRAYPSFSPTNTPEYTKVHVLLLRWADDDLADQRQSGIEDLQNVFSGQFNFSTDVWHIPNARPAYCLERKVNQYLKSHQEPGELLIIYYGGQSQFDREGRTVLRCNTKSGSPMVEWHQIEPTLDNATSDVLVLLDCSFTLGTARRDSPSGSIKEVLAASGKGFPSAGVGRINTTFTRVLIEKLKALSGRPFTAAMLHNHVMNNRSNLGSSPFHALLGGERSITLSALHADKPKLHVNGRASSPASQDDSEQAMQAAVAGAVEALQSLKTPATTNPPEPPARVLMSLCVKDDARLDVSEFRRWMLDSELPTLNTPPFDIRLESIYLCPSVSRLALVTLPVAVWDMLSENPAYTFVGFVNSANPVENNGTSLLPPYPSQRVNYVSAPNGKFHQQPQQDGREIRPRPPLPMNHDETAREPDGRKRKRTLGQPRPEEKQAFTPINVSPPSERPLRPESTKMRVAIPAQQPLDTSAPPRKRQNTGPKTPNTAKHGRRSPDSQTKFPCTFHHYGCASDFRSKNEWKRHVQSQHLRLGFWRCDVGACAQSPTNKPKTTSTSTGSAADFIRKDLFTQHHRRMHCPWPNHAYQHPPSAKAKEEFEASLEEVRRRCWVKVRDPPNESFCGFCRRTFEGPGSWEERMEHVGRHLERGDFSGVEGSPGHAENEEEDIAVRKWLMKEELLEMENADGDEMGDVMEKEAGAKEEGLDGDLSMVDDVDGNGARWRWKLVGART